MKKEILKEAIKAVLLGESFKDAIKNGSKMFNGSNLLNSSLSIIAKEADFKHKKILIKKDELVTLKNADFNNFVKKAYEKAWNGEYCATKIDIEDHYYKNINLAIFPLLDDNQKQYGVNLDFFLTNLVANKGISIKKNADFKNVLRYAWHFLREIDKQEYIPFKTSDYNI